MLFLRSLAFNLVMWVTAVLFAPLALATIVLRPIDRYHVIKRWAHFILWCLRWICGVRYVVHGREHLPKGPAIILSKHQSAWETIAFQRIFPPQVWVLKQELLWLPFFGWGLAMTQPIAINRKSSRHALDQVVKQGSERLRGGRWVVVFPEGARMPVGTRGKYNPGGALLAARSGYPVVPVAHNSGRVWPPRSFIKRPGTIEVVIGPLIESRGKSAKQIIREAEEWIETTMQRL